MTKEEIFRQAAELISKRAYGRASELLESAIDMCGPEDARALERIDAFYMRLGNWEMRLKTADKALAMGADPRAALPFKALALAHLNRFKESLTVSGLYIKRFGIDYNIFMAIGYAYQETGRSDMAVAYVEKLLAKAEESSFKDSMAYCSSIMNMQGYARVYAPGKYKSFIDRIYKSTKERERAVPPLGGGLFKKLRVAYVSPDFKEHPVGFFIYPVIMNTPADEHRMICFSLFHVEKRFSSANMFGIDFAEAFKSRSKYQVIEHMPEERMEKAIMREKPDIVFDLSSHTTGNKLALFAKRLAPVQITYIGWPSTTGVSAMDYNIVDAITDPPGAEEFYTEKLIRMSKTSLCHVLAPKIAPAPEPPVKKNGYITFGCFCNIQKMTEDTLRLISKAVKAVKGSKLLLIGRYHDEVREEMYARLAAAGVEKHRAVIEFTAQGEEYPKSYGRADIILDTIPFNGATTTCDAINMGVPVVTLAGDTQPARRGLSILTNLGLNELIAYTEDEYVKIAKNLAADVDRLQFYRDNLRDIKSRSNLADADAFINEYVLHIRKAWADCCREHGTPAPDYGKKTDGELKEELNNAERYIKFDRGEDVMNEYRLLTEECKRRGL